MQRIQVIHFVEALGKGGLENVIDHIVTNLNPQLFDVTVVCRIEGGHTADKIIAQGIPVTVLKQHKIPIHNLVKTLRLLKTQTVSILHCHGLFASSSEAIMGLRSGYKSVFVHVHNLEEPRSFYERFKLNILKRSISNFVAVSNSVRSCLLQYSVRNVDVIHNAVDTRKFLFHKGPGKEKFGFPENKFVLGMIGRIVQRKGFDHFVEIVRNIQDVSGIVVGEGPYEDRLRTLITEKNLQEKIKILPFQSQDTLPSIYSNLDALFLFSEKEGLPLALLESQSVGVPYIGNAVGGIGEIIINGHNGFIIDSLDLEQVEDKIMQLKKNMNSFRTNARRVIEEEYSIKTMVGKIERLYMKSLS